MRRIQFLPLAALCATLAAAQQPTPRPIKINSGKLQGFFTADQKVIAYKGIPYAQPPVEDLRWRPPQPVGRLKGTFPARDFGPRCIQFNPFRDMIFHDSGPSEDCLTLNVWAPSSAVPSKKSPGLPVMVWIHGGGFSAGGSSEARQDGEVLAHRGVIVVSMNYRLGIFGFLALPELTGESANHTSGNYGLMDQTAALAWVQRNIAVFGGDPGNVTLFGESAGSRSVGQQMASPVTRGLFAKAIGESSSDFYSGNEPTLQREQAERIDANWTQRAFGSNRLFYLRQLPVDEILKAVASGKAPAFRPIIDGFFLPDTVRNLYVDGKQAHIPLLAGWNSDEAQVNPSPNATDFTAQAHARFGRAAADFLALYPASNDAEAARSANQYAVDQTRAYSDWAWLETHAKTSGAPVYRYFFALASSGSRFHPASEGAFHSDDIEYVFGTLDSRPGMAIRPEDRALSELMQQYWTNFAKSKSGDPNGPGLPQWPTYGPATNWQVMRLDATPEAKPDILRPRYLFLDSKWNTTNN
jgi:para-nitrobenzyl esterase